jgi:hypothetical protein
MEEEFMKETARSWLRRGSAVRTEVKNEALSRQVPSCCFYFRTTFTASERGDCGRMIP